MQEYLVCYDYGTGGLWWWIAANTVDEIAGKYRDVTVFDTPPDWWNDDISRRTEHRLLSDPDTEALATLRR